MLDLVTPLIYNIVQTLINHTTNFTSSNLFPVWVPKNQKNKKQSILMMGWHAEMAEG